MEKKHREKNFTAAELHLLMKCVLQEIHWIENKKTDGANLKEKNQAWLRVKTLFESANIETKREVSSLKIKYENIKRNLKKKLLLKKPTFVPQAVGLQWT